MVPAVSLALPGKAVGKEAFRHASQPRLLACGASSFRPSSRPAASPRHGRHSRPPCIGRRPRALALPDSPPPRIAAGGKHRQLSCTMHQAVAGRASPAAEEEGEWDWKDSKDMPWAYGGLLAVLAIGAVPGVPRIPGAYVLYFTGLAIATIYIGAHRGLCTRQRETLGLRQGLLVPVFASVALFGAYCVITFFPDFSIQQFLSAYFGLVGFLAVSQNLRLPLRRFGALGKETIFFSVPGWVMEVGQEEDQEIKIAPADIMAVTFALGLACYDAATSHNMYTANNLIATCLAAEVLSIAGLRSFASAGAVLAGLLLYDVFWVFGSESVVGDNVMVAVATSDVISGPIKLIFPRFLHETSSMPEFGFSLLGLGDVAVPGLLACLMLRFDASRTTDMVGRAQAAAAAFDEVFRTTSKEDFDSGAVALNAADAAADAFDDVANRQGVSQGKTRGGAGPGDGGAAPAASSGPQGAEGGGSSSWRLPARSPLQRTYFTRTLAAYSCGLGIAFLANWVTDAGQPALLYLCPATLGAVLALAKDRNELGALLSFRDRSGDKDMGKDMAEEGV